MFLETKISETLLVAYFIHGYGNYMFGEARQLVDEPLLASERRFFYALWRDVVDGQRQLLVAVVLIEIMAR